MKTYSLISPWTRLAIVLAVLIGLGGPAVAGNGSLLRLKVIADPGTLDIIASPVPGQGPFYVTGEIFDADVMMGPIGTFHCWGFFIAGGTVTIVSQEYDLDGRGKIQVQGIEDEGPRAITGGTGQFRNVRGEMTGANLSNFPEFTVTFKLIGAKSR